MLRFVNRQVVKVSDKACMIRSCIKHFACPTSSKYSVKSVSR